MRIERSVTAVSWIPSEAVTGIVYRVPFTMGVAHYDDPPPDRIDDLDAFVAAGGCRFANHARPWIEVEDGVVTAYGHGGTPVLGSTTLRLGAQAVNFAAVTFPVLRETSPIDGTAVRFVQTAGGRAGLPAPRRVRHPPYVQLAAPVAWTTLSVTLHTDGTADYALEGASPFPRHWVYDEGELVTKSALIDYDTWSVEAFGRRTPWGDEDSPALVSEVETALERVLARQIMTAGSTPLIQRLDPGTRLTQQGEPGDEIYLLLDGVLEVEVDGAVLAEIGPGAVLGERAVLEGGRRTSTLIATTKCTVAVAPADAIDTEALRAVSEGHRREEG
ncbi:MAG: cyclic nucleotide-binding domain-containing protein [Nocardioidaceae bacterium]